MSTARARFSEMELVEIDPPTEEQVRRGSLAGITHFRRVVTQDKKEVRNQMGEIVYVAYFNPQIEEVPVWEHHEWETFRDRWMRENPGVHVPRRYAEGQVILTEREHE